MNSGYQGTISAIPVFGISESPRKRLRAGNIDHLFTSLVVSDEVGIRKPHKEIFDMKILNRNTRSQILWILYML
ncbi:hypothetical protein PGLA_20090 [Paenibacillus glacialis]|uniref:Uncharacterized protein n=1 Tax=Paenibacillus glacialis TaxID=494026 RepID=A0A168HPK9_9BACL|nr:hypothetical protein PGLA_20090 [Paenibacillus glacialis]